MELIPYGKGATRPPGDSAAPACWAEERGFPDGPGSLLQHLLEAMPGKQAQDQPHVVLRAARLS